MSKSASGKVTAFDQGDRTITLDGANMFSIAPAVDMTTVRTGDFVAVEYDDVPEMRHNAQRNDPPMRDIHVASAILKTSPDALAQSPNVLVRPGPIKPTPKVNTTASLKAK